MKPKFTLSGYTHGGRWITLDFNKRKDAEAFALENCLRWFIGKKGLMPVMDKAVSQ